MTCPRCGQARLPFARVCGHCQQPFGPACPHCHSDVDPTARICGDCGVSLAGDRRPVTVLFCDLVASTALSQQLDPEDLRQVHGMLRHLFSEVAAAHHGHIFQNLGDGTVFYFGYLRAQEDDAERAVRCGLALARRVAALPSTLVPGSPLAVRVGIHTSPVAFAPSESGDMTQWTAYGDATNIAARLQASAEAGAVVVSDATWNLVSPQFSSRSLGALPLKGVRQPMVAWCITGVSSGARDTSDVGRRPTPLIGRQHERAIIEEAWQAAQAGTPHFILLRGEPGTGKSRLARLSRDRALSADAQLLWIRATPGMRTWPPGEPDAITGLEPGGQPFQPIIGLLEQTFGLKRGESEESRLAALQSAFAHIGLEVQESVSLLGPLFGVQTQDPPQLAGMSAARRRHHSLALLTDVIRALVSTRPTLLVFEDLHWADASTSELLAHVVTQLADVPLLALFTARPEHDRAWAEGTSLRTLDLERLKRTESEAIARAIAGGKALPEDVLRQILTRSDGVPLFVEELTRSILESGVLEERSASWETIQPLTKELIPVVVHAPLAARIDRLGSARETARLAATIGREFSFALLHAVSDRDEPTLRKDLLRLKDAGLAWESGESGPDTFVFKHALVRDAAYESLLRQTRQEYHGRIADALRGSLAELAAGRNDLVAIHLTNAGNQQEAVPFWEAAGHDALRRTANFEAAGYFRRAIACLQTTGATQERKARELALQNVIAPVLMSVYGWASTEVEDACQSGRALAEELGRPDQLYGPMWGVWSVYFLRGELLAALPAAVAVQQMSDIAGMPLLQVTGRHATSYTRLFRGEFPEALEQADAGLALFDFDRERTLATAFQLSSTVSLRQSRAQALWMMGRLDEADLEDARMLQLARDLDHRPSLAAGLAFALQGGGIRHLHGGGARYGDALSLDHLRDLAEELSQLSRDEGFFMWYAVAEVYRGLIGATTGDEGARHRMLEGLELFVQTRTRVTLVMMNVLVAEALYEMRDDERTALGLLDQAEAEMESRHERFCGPEIRRVRGRFLARQGEAAAAESEFRHAIAAAVNQGAPSLELRAALDLHALLSAIDRRTEAQADLEAAWTRVTWPLNRPEPAHAHAILGGSSTHLHSLDWSLSCPTPLPFPGRRISGPPSAH